MKVNLAPDKDEGKIVPVLS